MCIHLVYFTLCTVGFFGGDRPSTVTIKCFSPPVSYSPSRPGILLVAFISTTRFLFLSFRTIWTTAKVSTSHTPWHCATRLALRFTTPKRSKPSCATLILHCHIPSAHPSMVCRKQTPFWKKYLLRLCPGHMPSLNTMPLGSSKRTP